MTIPPLFAALAIIAGAAAQVATWWLMWKSWNSRVSKKTEEEIAEDAIMKSRINQMWKTYAEDHGIPPNGG